jgi:hypothetical protein
LFTGWGEHKETYRGLHAGEDMSGVPQNFIFYEIVHERNFSSSQCHASVMNLTPLASRTHVTSSVVNTTTPLFSHSSCCKLYTQSLHHPKTRATSSIEVKKGRKYVVWKRGFVD